MTDFNDSPAEILMRMKELEMRLGTLDDQWGKAARNANRLKYEVEKTEARTMLLFKGRGTVQEVKARVTDAMWVEHAALMTRFVTAESEEEGCSREYKALDRELSSLQTRLNALQRIEGAPHLQGQHGRGF